MASLKVTVNSDVEKKVRDRINAALQDDGLLNEVGTIAKNTIVATIITAKEPATGKPFANPEITPEWRQRKRRLSTVNTPFDPSAGGGSKKARLLFTGQFLKSIVNTITRIGGRKVITVAPSGTHQPYMGIRGEPVGRPIENQTLGQYLIEQGRDWAGFPESSKKRLVTAARNYLRRKLTSQKK